MLTRERAHPYIPNSAPAVKREMLRYLGVASVDDLYAGIPEELKLRRPLRLPAALSSELELRRHIAGLLERNVSCEQYLNFQGGGCWQHLVPAVCDEVASRGEFVTAYTGSPHSNLGSFQAAFECQSLLGELVGMDAVSSTTYDWGAAAASGLLMASRITGRQALLISQATSPERLRQIQTIVAGRSDVRTLGYDGRTGWLDVADLRKGLSDQTAAVYLEVPSYLGVLEPHVEEIAELIHRAGALFVVGVDPISLGVLAPPGGYGADIVCGSIQPLGIHMNYGGGLAGFIATPDEERYVQQYPNLLLSILPTERDGEHVFGWMNFDTTSYELRDASREVTGTTQQIWAIVAGCYLALMGPAGLRELGEGIMQRVSYAMRRLARIPGVRAPRFEAVHFKEFVVNFDGSGKSVAEINARLRLRGIFGGIDLSRDFPELGQSALYCVTEIHSRDDIDRLAAALEEAIL